MNDNDLDKKIKNIFIEEQIPPIRYDYMIKRTLNNLKHKKKYNLKSLKICVSCICCLIIVLTSITFAKDIENYIKRFFNNSTDAINSAVENNYIQEIDTNYTYDKNIGIKVESLIIDDLYLDISFKFNVSNETIKFIRFDNFEITNEKNQVIYQSEISHVENYDELPLYTTVTWINQPIKVSDTEFSDSILLGLKQGIDNFENLYISVKTIKVIYNDNTEEILDGNWIFNVNIDEDMKKSLNVEYGLTETNQYVESCIGILSPTGMIVELTLKQQLNFEDFTPDIAEEFFIKINNKQYLPEYVDFSTVGDNKIIFHFNNIGLFSDNFDIIFFNLGIYDLEIELKK